jgi:hypothetical protein
MDSQTKFAKLFAAVESTQANVTDVIDHFDTLADSLASETDIFLMIEDAYYSKKRTNSVPVTDLIHSTGELESC